VVALGRPGTGVGGFAASHRQALEARRVAQLSRRRPGAVVRYRDVGLTALASIDPALARSFVEEELGPLAEPTDDMRRLTATLRVYLEERASPRRAARRLGLQREDDQEPHPDGRRAARRAARGADRRAARRPAPDRLGPRGGQPLSSGRASARASAR
jgi:hypothetical protein